MDSRGILWFFPPKKVMTVVKELESYAWLERLVMRELSFHEFSKRERVRDSAAWIGTKDLAGKYG